MDGLLVKLLVSPILVVLADALFPEVDYSTLYYSIGVGFVLALAGYWLERRILRPGTLWMSTAGDFILGFVIVYASAFLLPAAARVTPIGAGFVAIFFGVAEYLQHRWLIRTGRATEATE
ncbi:hypothetical protein [Brevibacillus choshinensis]|uniref:DUF2512 family protein n=1 Tax=Brevibacillus choshinensis TaxID=54911 RepID=A0ABX7FP63_BRECH|nr:hypothetical protein [Brevibacillus choshinensis]QRG67101.1 hypothetical protein JNE38_27160 [Brevibacillus choshinensis]